MTTMKILILNLALMVALSVTADAKADYAKALCQDKYSDGYERFNCLEVLIGNIDAIKAHGAYCPDGHTSYAYIIDTWHRLMAAEPEAELDDLPTAISMRIAIASLGLDCKK